MTMFAMVVAKLERTAVPREHMLFAGGVLVPVMITGTGSAGAPRTGKDLTL